ncbi:MAG: hypothetical protein ACYC8T_25500 [Myxococcaceae bacterium]
MPKITKVKIDDLVAASKKYVDAQLKSADVNHNKLLSPTEAKRLAADLRDNFDSSGFKLPSGSVKAADVAKEFVVMMEAWAKASDKNHDGYLSTTETRSLPKVLRDNVENYMKAQEKAAVTTGSYTTRDTTPKARIQEHLAAFGSQPISYEKAFAIALKAVATEEESGLPAFVREFGGPDGAGLSDPKKIDAEVKALLKAGTVELVPTGEEIPTGEENKDAWIFSVSTDGQGDNGLWAIVDRKTGEASVTNFN